MRYRALGRSGLQVSEIGLGTMNYGWKTNEKEAENIIDRALDHGVNLIDTSNSYGRGKSEQIVGNILKSNKKRSQVILATKFHKRMSVDINDFGNTRRHIIQQCEASLKRLQTEYIDLYQIHYPHPEIPIDETLYAFDTLIRQGKIIYGGMCNFDAWRCVEANWTARDIKTTALASEQIPYNLLDRSAEIEILPMAQDYGLGVIVWSPLAEGILSGKYKRGKPLPSSSRYAVVDKPGLYSARLTDKVFSAIEKLDQIARKKEVAMSTLSIAWCLATDTVSSVLIGPSDSHQFDDNYKALEIEFDEILHTDIDNIFKPEQTISSFRVTAST